MLGCSIFVSLYSDRRRGESGITSESRYVWDWQRRLCQNLRESRIIECHVDPDTIVNNMYMQMMEDLGYDIEKY